jgi:hypothetical protein
MIRFLLLLLSLPVLALSQGSTNDYLLSQKPASGPLVVRPVTPAVNKLLGWGSSINTPIAITLGTGLSLTGSTLNSTASTPAWGDITGIPAAITTLSSATAAGLALMDDADASAQRTTLGLGTLATQSGTLTDYLTTATAATTYQPLSATLTTLSSATAAGLALMDDADATAQRTTLGLGTLATQSGTLTDYLTTATAATTYQPLSATLTTLSSATAAGLALMDDADAAAQRTTLGLGTLATQSGTFSGTSSGTNTGDNAVNSNYSGLVSNATHTGDATGATALTLATVNSDVGSYGSATAAPAVTVNAKGLVTAVTTNTITPAVGSITGLGTGVSTFLGTPTLANLNTAVSDADLATLGANTFTAVQRLPNGTAAAPALNFGDTTTGIYRNASNEIGFSTNGTLRWNISSSGGLFHGGTNTWLPFPTDGNFYIGGPMQIRQSNGGTNVIRIDASSSTSTSQYIGWTAASVVELALYYAAPATLQLGNNTATPTATAIAQTIKGPNATGTTSTGGSLTLAGGTGTSAGGAVIISTAATTTQTERARFSSAGVTIGASGTAIASVISATATLDFPSTNEHECSAATITVTGAAVGDVVALGIPTEAIGTSGVFFGYVSAADTVTVRYHNTDKNSAVNPASGTFRATVIKH